MYERFVVAAITSSISSLGVLTNLTVFLSALRLSSMNSSFGVITKNQAICNLIICLFFLVYISSMQLSGTRALDKYSHFLGFFVMSVYGVSGQCHLLIASNRFCAVFLPNHYEQLFSKFGTILMINVIWTFSIITCVVLYEILGCYITYDDDSRVLVVPPTDFCNQVTWYSDFMLNSLLAIGTLLINLITAYKAGRNSRMLMNAAGMQMSKQQRHRELNFIRQAFCQGVTVFTGQVIYYVIAPLFPHAIVLFFVSSLWPFMHGVEGGIIIASNEEMRKFVFKKEKQSQATMFVTSVSAS